MIVDRKTDSIVGGATIGCFTAGIVSATGYAMGGSFNPVRLIGGFMITTMEINQIPLMMIPFLGAVLGQMTYKYC